MAVAECKIIREKTAGGGSLDDAYNLGSVITADAGPVEILGAGGLDVVGRVKVGQGSAAAPAIIFDDVPEDSGFFQRTTDEVNCSVGGVELWRATATSFHVLDPVGGVAGGAHRLSSRVDDTAAYAPATFPATVALHLFNNVVDLNAHIDILFSQAFTSTALARISVVRSDTLVSGKSEFHFQLDGGTDTGIHDALILTDDFHVVCGEGERGTVAGRDGTLRAVDLDSATNIIGADLFIGAGQGRGNADVGRIILQTPRVQASGTAEQTRADLMILDEDRVGIGTPPPTPTALLHLDQADTVGTVEVLALDQADLDVGFVDFIGTATADANSPISTFTTSGGTTHHLRVSINGANAWIAASTSDPTA